MNKYKNTNFLFRMITVCFAVLFSACESMMRYIEVEPADFQPVLAVSSIINTDGTFSVSFTEARSIGSYRNWRPEEETIIRSGEVTLYDETAGETVTRIQSDGFDMSLRQYYNREPYIRDSLHFEAGHTYRLTLDIEGYPTATATATIPDAPIIEEVSLNLQQTLHFSNAYRISPFTPDAFQVHSIDCSPLNLRLTDNSPQRDYYMSYMIRDIDSEAFSGLAYHDIAVSDRALIQDNPDMEAAQLLMDSEIDAFLFERLLFSDMSFANTAGTVKLLIDPGFLKQGGYYDKYPDPPCDNPPVHVTVYICVAHLSANSYAHYRSISLQRAGMDFFSEPVSIVSNIENGYGCFSAINTVRYKLAEYESCDLSY
ncbi:MAG: DUF4249 domain-containing protein [Prevotellaceae bacterium]|jgi:hypothetical protein|nr:DUF4249 domain-containing protein [Prevotellaceae bacterium]